ncbi:MAG: DMT family transporter [Alphaproteobacteria bacterium]|nr:DMT family transporter [Alphaproteobacteria bacterium]
MGRAEWTMLGLLSILWGGSFFFVAVALRDLPPLTIVLGRVLFGALALLLVLRLRRLSLPRAPGLWRDLFILGFLANAAPFCLMVWGQLHVPSGLASILNAGAPLFTVLVAHVLTRDEKLTRRKLLGVAAGMAGVAAMVGPEALRGLGENLLGQLAILLGTFCYALAAIFGRRFHARGVPPLVTATGQVLAASVLILPLALILDRPWDLAPPGPAALGAVAGLAILSTALAYILYFRILNAAGATNLLLVTFLIPLTAILLGALFLDERLAFNHFAGMALIGTGLAVIDGRLIGGQR